MEELRFPHFAARSDGARDQTARARLGVVVDLHEAQVVVGDLLGGRGALEVAAEEALQRVPPDRAADREADEALDAGRLAQPVVDLLVAGAAAQQHALDVLAAVALAGLLGEHLRVLALVDALDLPDVDLDRRSPGCPRSRGASAPGAARRRSGRCRRRPARAGRPRPARAARRGTAGRARAASRRAP